MLPNPFEKPLPKLEETDPIKNEAIVREFLGDKAVAKYKSFLQTGSGSATRDLSVEELMALSGSVLAEKERLIVEAQNPAFERFVERSYRSQMKALQEIGFLEKKQGILGFTAIDKKFYPAPTREAVKNYFLTIPNLQEKMSQGFTRLLVVPFGTSLDTMLEKTGELIKKRAAAGTLSGPNGAITKINVQKPIWIFDTFVKADTKGTLLYAPNPMDDRGVTKLEFLQGTTRPVIASRPQPPPPFPGYHIFLAQQDLRIPRKDFGASVGGRDQIEAWQNPVEYAQLIKTNPAYAGELFMAPEDWLTLFATNLHQTNKVINDPSTSSDSRALLLGARLQGVTRCVPYAYWSHGDEEQADLSGNWTQEASQYAGVSTVIG